MGAGCVACSGHSPGGPGRLGIADPEGLSQGEDAIQRRCGQASSHSFISSCKEKFEQKGGVSFLGNASWPVTSENHEACPDVRALLLRGSGQRKSRAGLGVPGGVSVLSWGSLGSEFYLGDKSVKALFLV